LQKRGSKKFKKKTKQKLESVSTATPTLTTVAVDNITETSAVCGGTITATGGSDITARGVCYAINPNPTIADNTTDDGTGMGKFYQYFDRFRFPGTNHIHGQGALIGHLTWIEREPRHHWTATNLTRLT